MSELKKKIVNLSMPKSIVATKWVLEGAVDGVWGLIFVLYVEKLNK